MNLTDAKQGELYRIRNLSKLNGIVRKRLLDLGVIEGVEVAYLHTMPFGGPYILEVCGQKISLRKKDVHFIEVEEL